LKPELWGSTTGSRGKVPGKSCENKREEEIIIK
jgi:hypothetical protein